MSYDLFIGITTWNSELFLDACLRGVRQTTGGVRVQLAIVDNVSTDDTVNIAKRYGVPVHIERCSQAIALNRLLAMSRAPRTLLIHSDVVLLSSDWFRVCNEVLDKRVALVSPEDIGCGPLTRPYGRGKPESCFMLFDTAAARRARTWTLIRRAGVPWPTKHLDLDDYYVTHDLPKTLERIGCTWRAMKVHPSPSVNQAYYDPEFTPEYWSSALGRLRYAMGNFYSLSGVVTHYHNWFDRVPKDVPMDSKATTEPNGRGLPLAFLSMGTRNFLNDYGAGNLVLPDPLEELPDPAVTQQNSPSDSVPFRECRTS